MQQDLKLLASPQTTNILEPSMATIRKGRPSKKDKSTKRELSYFEHVEPLLSCSSNLTPVGRYLKKLGIKTKACENNLVDSKYLLQMPKHMRPYIIAKYDMPSDGNCGYWVVVKHFKLHNQRLENPCKFVREAMVDNLMLHSDMYKKMWDECGFEEIKNRIQCTHDIGFSEWMQMSESGFLIAETFGTVVVLISNHMYCTFVSTTVRVNLLTQNRMVVIGNVDNSHFVGVKLSPVSPLPPTAQFSYF